jgi:streptogramin lyase
MYKKIFFLLIQSLFVSLFAQNVPIGQFKEYLSYNRFQGVAQDDENIYAATNQSILVVDKRDGSKEKWSKVNGLSEIGIQTIHSDRKGRLIIAYRNSNIDIIKDYKVNNVRDILNKQLTGSKTINNISTFEDLAYFACDFGVVVLDLKTLLVKDSWFTVRMGEAYRAIHLTTHDGRYYLATDKGIFSLPVTASNPADFSIWTLESELPKMTFRLLCSYQDKLFAVRENGVGGILFVYENSHWQLDESMRMDNYRSFEVRDGKMLVCDWGHIKLYTGDKYSQYYWEPVPSAELRNGYMATLDEKGNVWVADNSSGLVHIDIQTRKHKIIRASGPENNSAYGLCFTGGTLAVVPGARANSIEPVRTPGAISTLNTNTDHWWSHGRFSIKQFPLALGFNSVAINPLDTNEVFIASWMGGLYKINKTTDAIVWYNYKNSSLDSLLENNVNYLSGLTVDRQNNLWMLQTDASHMLKVKELGSGNWYSMNIGASEVMAEHLLIDSRNYKWVTLPSKVDAKDQLAVFFENGSLTNSAVHKHRRVDLTSQAHISASRTTCLAEDREGRIWIGSNQGVKVIYDAGSVFDRIVYAKNILVEQVIGDTSYVQPLLGAEYITCIAVDAADRKWIGTQSAGVFLISPSGTQQLFHFTAENSPLFSNNIHDIKINPENGEVFMATAEGLISYRGTATGGKENYKEVLVYPNPVRSDYFGPIAVKGLMEDSFCKITDASGKLVWQSYAYGGQLIWNGKDFYGRRPATGVYFVMASSKTGKERKVAKFLFVQ